jgi:hypothetical protein
VKRAARNESPVPPEAVVRGPCKARRTCAAGPRGEVGARPKDLPTDDCTLIVAFEDRGAAERLDVAMQYRRKTFKVLAGLDAAHRETRDRVQRLRSRQSIALGEPQQATMRGLVGLRLNPPRQRV